MAIQDINIGVSANDGSGDPLRTAFDKTNDNFDDLDSRVTTLEGSGVTIASIIRSDGTVAATGAAGQVIAFTSVFSSVYNLIIVDYNGLGIEVTAQDQNGFTITSLTAGNFGYTAIVEQ